MAHHTRAQLALINKQRKELLNLLLQKTGTKHKDIVDWEEKQFIKANLDELTDEEKKPFELVIKSLRKRAKTQHTRTELALLNKQQKELLKLLIENTETKHKYIVELAEQSFIRSNLAILTDEEKKQFDLLVL